MKAVWNKTLFQYCSKFNCHRNFLSFPNNSNIQQCNICFRSTKQQK